jgi:uncharacterized protein YndB with AHSA1/START domain
MTSTPLMPLVRMTVATGVALAAAATPAGARAQPAQTPAAQSPVTVTKIASPEKALRFEVVVPAARHDVWVAFTTSDGLATWLAPHTRVDPRPGGDWLVIFPGSTGGGTIRAIQPEQRLTIAALAPDQFPTVRATRTTAVFEFTPVDATSTRVTLTQTGWKTGAEWDAAYDYLATGNAGLLTQLHQRFTAGPIAWPKGH